MRANDNIDHLITLYLQGEASDEQIQTIKSWIEEGDENRAYFEKMEDVYYFSPKTEHAFDAHGAWMRMEKQIEPNGSKSLNWLNWRMLAAAAVIGVIGTWTWFSLFSSNDLLLAATAGIEKHNLPNGVELTLNKGSRMAFNDSPNSAWVELEGDGFFHVGEQVNKTFYVKTKDLIIRDIGTSFHVRNNSNADTVFFEVMDGLIVCYAGQDDSLRVGKGQAGYYCRSNKQFSLCEIQVNQSAYATKKFQFENATMNQVLADLHSVYPVTIQVSDMSMLDCSISVSFDNQSIEEILDVIAITMNWELERSAEQWKFIGKGCTSSI